MQTIIILLFLLVFLILSLGIYVIFDYIFISLNLSKNLEIFKFILIIISSGSLTYILKELSTPQLVKITSQDSLVKEGVNMDKYSHNVTYNSNIFQNNQKEPTMTITKKAKNFFKVAGTTYNKRQDILEEFAKENTQIIYDGYSDEEIAYTSEDVQEYFVYEFDKIQLIPDKFHPMDNYAIQVHIVNYGMIGYVPKEINKLIYNLLAKCKSYSTEMRITGGNYKFFNYETDQLDIKSLQYNAEVYIDFNIEL